MPAGAKESPRCLIVDDHPVVRAGVRALLESTWRDAEIEDAPTVDEAGPPLEGPDVVIVDPWRAGVDVGDIVTRLRDQITAPIVIFTSDGGARLLSEALK